MATKHKKKPVETKTVQPLPHPSERYLRLCDTPTMLQEIFPDNCRPSIRWVHQQTANRKIPFIRLSGKILFDLDEVRAWINSNRVKAA